MIPYPVEEEMSSENENYLHSRTRIIVERTIGMMKNRFRILKVSLNQKRDNSAARTETEEMGRIIGACLVLHKTLIDLQDLVDLIAVENAQHNGNALPEDPVLAQRNVNQKRDQIRQYLFESKSLIKTRYGCLQFPLIRNCFSSSETTGDSDFSRHCPIDCRPSWIREPSESKEEILSSARALCRAFGPDGVSFDLDAADNRLHLHPPTSSKVSNPPFLAESEYLSILERL
jgi:hypothetical protein